MQRWKMGVVLTLAIAAGGTAAEPAWGPGVDGLSIRARTEKTVWAPGETPLLTVDLNNKAGSIGVNRIPYCEIEVDGVWYASTELQPVAGAYTAGPGVLEAFARVRIDPTRWARRPEAGLSSRERFRVLQEPERRLRLPPGKHTFRVACRVEGVLPVSRSVTLEITKP